MPEIDMKHTVEVRPGYMKVTFEVDNNQFSGDDLDKQISEVVWRTEVLLRAAMKIVVSQEEVPF